MIRYLRDTPITVCTLYARRCEASRARILQLHFRYEYFQVRQFTVHRKSQNVWTCNLEMCKKYN